jgi:hypothetical protein
VPRFEYRLNNAAEDYPVLYFYETMDEVEAAMRFVCDYFVKEGRTWLKTASAIEAAQYVMYMEEVPTDTAEAGNATQPVMPGWIAVEVREYRDGTNEYPLIHQFGFPSQVQALAHLIADTMLLFGQEWQKTSTEIDEDRQAYIYYCRKTEG